MPLFESKIVGHGHRRSSAVTGCRPMLVEVLEERRLLAGVPLITEFMAQNSSTLDSRSFPGTWPDWIEIYNPGPGPVDLQDWYLSDRKNELHGWQFPSSHVLGQDEYLIVFASGMDHVTPEGELHTNFRLSAGGEFLALVRPDGTTITSEYEPFYPPQIANVSYGLNVGFDDEAYFETPTPGQINPPFFKASVFSPTQGFYDGPIQVALDTAELSEPVYYTTDGSIPTTSDQLYQRPIRIDTTTVLRAKSLAPSADSTVYTQSYIYLGDVADQGARLSGFPDLWVSADGSTAHADYEMDPEVVRDPRYAASLTENLLTLPTVSLVADPSDLFNSNTGIYANPTGRGRSWERPVSIELIYPDDREGFQVDAGLRIQGGDSRNPDSSPKHSFRLLFKSAYGPPKLDFPLFSGSDTELFDNLLLRAGFADGWVHYDSAQRDTAVMLRDRWVRDTHQAMGQPASRGQLVQVYLNGAYWGVYELIERIDDAFGATHFGGRKLHYDVIDSGELADGTINAWKALFEMVAGDLESDEAYRQVQTFVDIPNFIDFMILNIFVGRTDPLESDWFAVRSSIRDEPFRFYVWDSERSLVDPDSGFSQLSDNAWDIPDGQPIANSPAAAYYLFSRLRTSAQFRRAFGDQVHRHLANAGALTAEATTARWLGLVDQLSEALVAESARWGDYRRDVAAVENDDAPLYTPDDQWLPNVQHLQQQYFPLRSANALQQFRSEGLYPAVQAPAFSRHGGQIDPGVSLVITAPSGTIYYTTDGSDPWQFGQAVNPSASVVAGPIALSEDVVIRARTLDQGRWSAVTEATFYKRVPLQITEIFYNNAITDTGRLLIDDFDFIELTNVGHETINLDGIHFTLGISFSFDDSPVMALEPGQRVVLVRNMVAFLTQRASSDVLVGGQFFGRLDNTGERITLSGSLGQTIADFTFDDEWYPITDTEGFSLVVRHEGMELTDWSDPWNWRPSHFVGGSPGTVDPGYNPGSVVINEALTHSDGEVGDWIELYNTTDNDIDLSGWYLSDTKNDLALYRVPEGTMLAAGGYVTFSEGDNFGREGLPGVIIPFRIDKLGESIRLTSAAPDGSLGGYREEFTFGYAFNSVSFIRHVNSTGEIEWIPSRANTPGEPNTKPLVGVRDPGAIGLSFIPAVINEMMYHPKGDGDEYIELHNPYDEPAPLFGPFHHEDTWRFTAGVFYNFPLDVVIPGGGYALVVGIEPDEFRRKYGVPDETPIFGPYTGELLNSGEHLTLSRPADRASFVPLSMADQVVYNATAGWPKVADGLGASLNRISFVEYGNDILNWTAGFPTPGRPNSDLEVDFFPEAGDANVDREFNQLDLIQVLRAQKYGTGQPASWAEGDWNANGVADRLDVVAALQTGNYLQGPYSAGLSPEGHSDLRARPTGSGGPADSLCERSVDLLFKSKPHRGLFTNL